MSTFYRTAGGTILEMDVPAAGSHAGELHAEKVARGDLVEVDAKEVDTVTDTYGTDPRTGDPLTSSRFVLKADAKRKPKEHEDEPYRGAHVAAGPVEIVDRNGPAMVPQYVEPFDIEATDVEDPTQVVPVDEEGEPLEIEEGPSAPAKSASKADWVEWAVANGADPDEADALTKAELTDTYGS